MVFVCVCSSVFAPFPVNEINNYCCGCRSVASAASPVVVAGHILLFSLLQHLMWARFSVPFRELAANAFNKLGLCHQFNRNDAAHRIRCCFSHFSVENAFQFISQSLVERQLSIADTKLHSISPNWNWIYNNNNNFSAVKLNESRQRPTTKSIERETIKVNIK